MKRCPVCKTKLNGNFSTCPVCGTKLSSYGFKEGPHGQFYIKPLKDSEIEELAQVYARKHSKKKKALLIAAACLCGAAVVSGTTYGITKAVIASSEANQKEYNVKFVGADGEEILQNEKLKKGQEITYKGSIPTKDAGDNKNYMFTGWDPVLRTGEKVVEDVTYKAQFKQIDMDKYLSATRTGNTCSVYFNKDFGQELKYLSIPNRIKVDGVMCTVTKIAAPTSDDENTGKAFENCESLISVEIPNTVSEIEVGAFRGCVNLQKVVLSDGLETIPERCFEYCDSLNDVTIPDSIKTIKTRAFAECLSLSKLTLTKYVNTVEPQAFAVDNTGSGIKSLTIESGDDEEYWNISEGAKGMFIASDPVENAKKFKDTTTREYQFTRVHNPYSTSSFTFTFDSTTKEYSVAYKTGAHEDEDVVVPSTYYNESLKQSYPVTSLGAGAFLGTSIRSVQLPESVTTIGPNAFKNCTNLASVNIENVQTIGASAFYNCKKLKKLNSDDDTNKLNDSVTNIYETTFYNSGITSITLPKNLTTIGESAFDSCFYLTDVDLNGNTSLEEISKYAFAITSIGSIEIPSTVRKIGYGAFISCSGLKTVTLNEGLRVIDGFAFAYDTSIETIAIPSTVDTFYSGCFVGCTGLTSMTCAESVARTKFQTCNINNVQYVSEEDCPYLEDICTDFKEAFVNSSAIHIHKLVFSAELPTEKTSLSYTCVVSEYLNDNALIIDTANNPDTVCLNDDTSLCKTVAEYSLSLPSTYIAGGIKGDFYLAEITKIGSINGTETKLGAARALLQSVDISPNITSIEAYAFYDCYNLGNISFPSNVKAIKEYALGHDSDIESREEITVKLSSIVIPSTLTYINALGNFCGYENEEFTYSNLKGVYFRDFDTKWTATRGYSGTQRITFNVEYEENLNILTKYYNYTFISDNYKEETDTVLYNPSYLYAYSNERYLAKGETATYEIAFNKEVINVEYFTQLRFYNSVNTLPIVFDTINQRQTAFFTSVVYENDDHTYDLTDEFNTGDNWACTPSTKYYCSYSTALAKRIYECYNSAGDGTLTIKLANTNNEWDAFDFRMQTYVKTIES